MKNFSAVLFDFDWVIANSVSFDRRALWWFLKNAGLNIPDEVYEKENWFTKSWKQILEILAEKYNFPMKQEEIENEVLEKERMLMQEGIEIDPWLKSFLEYCQEKNIKIAIGSNSGIQRIMWVLEKIELSAYFLHDREYPKRWHNIVSANDLTHHKPDPEVWLKCAEMLEVRIAECIVIEDGLPGLTGASQCWARGIYYHRFCRPEKACIELAERSVENFGDLIGEI